MQLNPPISEVQKVRSLSLSPGGFPPRGLFCFLGCCFLSCDFPQFWLWSRMSVSQFLSLSSHWVAYPGSPEFNPLSFPLFRSPVTSAFVQSPPSVLSGKRATFSNLSPYAYSSQKLNLSVKYFRLNTFYLTAIL